VFELTVVLHTHANRQRASAGLVYLHLFMHTMCSKLTCMFCCLMQLQLFVLRAAMAAASMTMIL
jgi:hypothetical protein